MQKAHSNISWENYPSDKTPVNEQNLNKMDVSIDTIDDRVIVLDTTKLDKTDAAHFVKSIVLDRDTGIFTITYYNGSFDIIDTLLEKIAVNFGYDATTQKLSITLDDGTVEYIDLSALITQYEFLDSDTIAFQVQSDGKIKAIVKEGSIEERHLRPDYLADIRVEVANAEASKNAAKESEENAKNSEENAAASEENAEIYKNEAETAAQNAKDSENAAKISEINAKDSETAAKNSENAAADSEQSASDSAISASTSAESASGSAELAENYSNISKSYAVGTGGEIRENDDSDNSKYYSEQSKNSADISATYLEKVEQAGEDALNMINDALDIMAPNFVVDLETGHLLYDGGRFDFEVNKNGHLMWGIVV